MFGLWKSELLLYGGLGAMTLAVSGAALYIAVFTFTGRRLKKKLEEEYGKPRLLTGNEGNENVSDHSGNI